MEKIILVHVFSNLRRVKTDICYLFEIWPKDVKINEKVDFEKLYSMQNSVKIL